MLLFFLGGGGVNILKFHIHVNVKTKNSIFF